MALSGSPLPEEQQVLSHKAKKRKIPDSEQKTSTKRKKLKHSLGEDEPDTATPLIPTPAPSSKSKRASRQHKKTLLPSESDPQDHDASDHYDLTLPDAAPTTNGASAPATNRSPSPSPSRPLSSPFHLQTTSLYLSLPPIALSTTTALSSLLTIHITPLLLTYYPPLRGVVLAISKPVLSSQRPAADKPPKPLSSTKPSPQLVLAHCANDGGLSYVWLTATFLLFRPQGGDELEGWLNVCSEGFVGLICYNYFQVAVARARIPRGWRWVPPGGEPVESKGKTVKKAKDRGKEKGKRTTKSDDVVTSGEEKSSSQTLVDGVDGDVDMDAEHREKETGYFVREDGSRAQGVMRFRVVDCEVVPGHDRETWSLQVEGTLLSTDEEKKVWEEEQQRASRREPQRSVMSGGLGVGSLDIDRLVRGV